MHEHFEIAGAAAIYVDGKVFDRIEQRFVYYEKRAAAS
ncbi:hypothetical protein KKY_2584 [Pelagibacterium halotolerans B2]|uniref:Uncharacterized protein n=1 Tax=Pelagibacterium halotolerans (strain DSM 22347 / JCM 15775 / CGMCC 1.7692 / B2) TaxID=1082931 RepID=G4RAR9_PELHB|nr:hypothetical protein KKY_2584 [Pelagibacterium halotolerans B2]